MFCQKAALKNLTKLIGKETCNFTKKETLVQMFSYEFCKISKNTFSYRTPFWLLLHYFCEGNMVVRINFGHRFYSIRGKTKLLILITSISSLEKKYEKFIRNFHKKLFLIKHSLKLTYV